MAPHEASPKPSNCASRPAVKQALASHTPAYPGRVPADIVFVVADKAHPVFTRCGSSVHTVLQITLRAALCETMRRISVPTLDGSELQLAIKGVIKPNQTHVINDKGLPRANGEGYGNMVVQFEVLFPDIWPEKEGVLWTALYGL